MNILNKFNLSINGGGITKSISISILNQVMSSGSTFALGFYLVRILSASEFGLYGIGFAIVLFYSGVGNALFLTQMVVHVPEKAPEERLIYAACMFMALLIFCFFTGGGSITILSLGNQIWPELSKYNNTFMAIVAASVANLLKDFFVRHSYTVRKEIWVLGINSSLAIALFLQLFASRYQTNVEINATGAMWILAISNVIGILFGLLLVKLPLLLVTTKKLISDWKEAWHGGVWALGGSIIIWGQSQAYVYLTAVMVDPAAVGMINAAKLWITPAVFLLAATNQILMPRLAALRMTNVNKMFNTSKYVTICFVTIAILYTMLFLVLSDRIVAIVIGDKYQNMTPLIFAWCLVLVLQFSRTGTSIVLQVMKEFRQIMFDNLWSAIIAIVCTVFLLQLMGMQGAILGSAIGELILSVLLYRTVLVHKRKAH
jgi:O-antigen/teichoic acid export membrane protein